MAGRLADESPQLEKRPARERRTGHEPASRVGVDGKGGRREKTAKIGPKQFAQTRFGFGKGHLEIVLERAAIAVQPLHIDQQCLPRHAGQGGTGFIEGCCQEAEITRRPVLKEGPGFCVKTVQKQRIAQLRRNDRLKFRQCGLGDQENV